MHDDDIKKDPFEEYKKVADPSKMEMYHLWQTAIGLQKVDQLETSSYLKELAIKNINGEISLDEVKSLLDTYYKEDRKQEKPRTKEADEVSTRICEIIKDGGFSFSPKTLIEIHKRLFDGFYDFAGKVRTYNITKSEWVLNGDTVTYGSSYNLMDTVQYDFDQEASFDYSSLKTNDDLIKHYADFVSKLWQVHMFGEGNTRTTAVFFIKYLRTKGYNITNDLFEQYSWYFRNALVRANYSNFKLGVYETTEYLELFLRNLLLNEKNELKNRYMHISFQKAKEKVEDPNDAIKEKYIELMKKEHLSQKTINYTLSLFDVFGFTTIFGRTEVMNQLKITPNPASIFIKKLAELNIIIPVNGFGKGKYRFNNL